MKSSLSFYFALLNLTYLSAVHKAHLRCFTEKFIPVVLGAKFLLIKFRIFYQKILVPKSFLVVKVLGVYIYPERMKTNLALFFLLHSGNFIYLSAIQKIPAWCFPEKFNPVVQCLFNRFRSFIFHKLAFSIVANLPIISAFFFFFLNLGKISISFT